MRYAAIALLALAGCAAPQWRHATADEARFRQDAMECDYDARKATAPIRSGLEAGFEQAQLRQQCMQVRGYTRVQ